MSRLAAKRLRTRQESRLRLAAAAQSTPRPGVSDEWRPAALDLAAEVGSALLSNGAAASEIVDLVLDICMVAGLVDVSVVVTYDQVIVSLEAEESFGTIHSRVAPVRNRTFNFGTYTATVELAQRRWPGFFIQMFVGAIAVLVASVGLIVNPGMNAYAVVVAVMIALLHGLMDTTTQAGVNGLSTALGIAVGLATGVTLGGHIVTVVTGPWRTQDDRMYTPHFSEPVATLRERNALDRSPRVFSVRQPRGGRRRLSGGGGGGGGGAKKHR